MVNGLDRFKAHFAAYSDRYVLIGGTASSLSMEELGGVFRVTKDLSNRKAAGEPVDSKNIRKHKNDIFRLFTVLDREQEITLAAGLKLDLTIALALIAQDPPDLKSLGISRMKSSEVLDDRRRFYRLSESASTAS